jgi:hypothetical protein
MGFLRAEQLAEPEPRFPLDVHACLDCGLIQVRDNVPAEYFRHYVYVPSTQVWLLGRKVTEHMLGLASLGTGDVAQNRQSFPSRLFPGKLARPFETVRT